MPKSRIAVVFGSDSDWPVMEKCVKQLAAFGEKPVVEVMSAHRNPERVAEFAASAESQDVEVIIAAAGMSNALAGFVAVHTCLPVIGCGERWSGKCRKNSRKRGDWVTAATAACVTAPAG